MLGSKFRSEDKGKHSQASNSILLLEQMSKEVATEQKEQQMKYRNKTIHKNPKANSWYTRFRHNGRQYYVSGKTQLECMRNLKHALNNIDKLNHNKHRTFIEWYNDWLNRFKKDIKPETLRDYNKSLNKLDDNFKNRSIDKITSFDIDTLLQREQKSRAKQKLYEFLRPIFKKAKDYKVISDNIFDVIEKPKHIKEEGIALTQAQQQEFLKLCDKNQYGNMFKFILYQGLRIGEMLALTYNDIDFTNKTITINKQLTPKGVVNYTKNIQSTRTIPLFDKAKMLIENKMSNKRIFKISYPTASRYLQNILIDSKLPKISIHDLRHTFITNCKNKNIPEYVIQAIVGHEIGSKVTNRVYTHFNLEDNLSYIDKLNT